MKKPATLALVLAVVAPASLAQETAKAVRTAAAAIEALDYGEFAYGGYGAWRPYEPPGRAEIDRLRALSPAVDDLDALLRDADAKVRTLALLLLFDRDEKHLLPRLAALLGDAAPTFPAANRIAFAAIGPALPRERWEHKLATVDDVVQQLLGSVLRFADPRGGGDAKSAFEAFWKLHGAPGANAVWLRVRLFRAHRGTTAVPEVCHEAVARVRAAVDALPSPDRELLTIGLPDLTFTPASCFASDDERIAAAKKLGDEVLLLCLAGDFPSADPGLRTLFCGSGVFGTHSSLHRFVLTPQHRIFGPGAAKRLLALETEQRKRAANTTGFVDAGWVTTAASLQPKHATEWLLEALDRFAKGYQAGQLAQLLAALVEFGDETSEAVVVDRFWRADITVMMAAYGRAEVLAALTRVPRAKALRVLRALLAAPAAAEVDPLTAAEFDIAAGALLGARPVGEEAVRTVWHPFGLQHLMIKPQLEQARAKHPVETERVFAAARSWCETIEKALRDL